MIKTAYEYLFIVLAGKIAMVRKEANGFSVVPVSDNGDILSSFEDPTQYWKDWVALTNFSIRHSEVDFAFLADKKDCRFAAEDAKKPEQLKTVQQTVWTKKTVLTALRTAHDVLGLSKDICVREKGKLLLELKDVGSEDSQVLYLTRFGVVKDEKDDSATIAKEHKEQKKAPKPVAMKSEPPKPVAKVSGIIGDSYNDPEALKLAVGDERKGIIVKIFNAMKRNYVKVEGLKEQVCFKSPTAKDFAVGDKVKLTVTAVNDGKKNVLYSIVVA